jgi:outer membrane protein
VPSDSETFATPSNLDTDVGFIGGGFIFGITRYIAAEFDVTRTLFDANRAGFKEGAFGTTNFALGAQYRFVDIPERNLVPYVGAGLDILVNDFDFADGVKTDVDTVVGVHVSGGVDYFIMMQVALNAEIKGVVAPDADIN